MSGTEWGVVLIGVAAIGWVNWYFFAGGRAAPPAGGSQDQTRGDE